MRRVPVSSLIWGALVLMALLPNSRSLLPNRPKGIASRFVSGYQEGVSGLSERDLHAWAEVYLPGGGWRGYDPTLGLAVSDRHIAVAASRTSHGAAPITGTFRGTEATTQMASH